MSDLARHLIRENIAKHRRGEDARVLDLGNCGMTEVPEEIGECVWVEELSFSENWGFWMDGVWSYKESSNKGEKNKIEYLTDSIGSIQKSVSRVKK